MYENALEAITSSNSLVIADFSQRDVDRLLIFLQIAHHTGRKLAIQAKDAYLLKTVGLLEPQVPDIAGDDSIVIYQKTNASRSPDYWQRNIYAEYQAKTVLADDISSAQDQFILCFGFFDIKELPSIRPHRAACMSIAQVSPMTRNRRLASLCMHQWLEHFNIRGFGLPVERDDNWQIPEAEQGLHASGHACGADLLKVARDIKPQVLIPLHSQHPELYINPLKSINIDIILPIEGRVIELFEGTGTILLYLYYHRAIVIRSTIILNSSINGLKQVGDTDG